MENTQQKALTLNEFYDKPAIYEVNGQEVALTPNVVKSYLTRGNDEVSKEEIVMFISLCKFQKLNPFLNEAYLVKFKGSPAQMITSKEAYMKRAFDCPNYDGLKAGIIVLRNNEVIDLEGSFMLQTDALLGGWATIFVKDKSNPSTSRLSLTEFSKGQSTWKTMPATMIRKVAIVNALREAFPKELGSLYIEEEPTFDKGNVVNEVKAEVKNETGKTPIPQTTPPAITAQKTVVQPPKAEVKPTTEKQPITDDKAAELLNGISENDLPF